MKFSTYSNVKTQAAELCTYERFMSIAQSAQVEDICLAVANEPDHEKRSELKKQLPIFTFQALFDGPRKNDLAQPSGVFMYDGDGIEDPVKFYHERIAPRRDELGILYVGLTPSQHGIRIVARCRKEFTTIAECQQWLGDKIGWPCDPQCKDWARSSFAVPAGYIFYLDQKGLFEDEPEVTYEVGNSKSDVGPAAFDDGEESGEVQEMFKGIPLKEIAHEWLLQNGGEPTVGERDDRLHKLAIRLRHITDYNEATLLKIMPSYGLSEKEMRSLIHSACTAQRTGRPRDLDAVLNKLQPAHLSTEDTDDEMLSFNSKFSTNALPPLPPLIRQMVNIAPPDFQAAVILCQLPILGTLGSKLRAQYRDGVMHSPTFQVSLEAPQASGKGFMTRMAELELKPLYIRDDEVRQEEKEFEKRVSQLKKKGVKITPENQDEVLGDAPQGIVRIIPPTASITKLLMRMDAARGLHLFSLSEEIDTVTKNLKRAFANYSDLLRVAFDNGRYGQDYASDTSFSGNVIARYNTLFSGTPKAMKRFYPDVEDGLVSRVCFVTLPDQFGKPMPVWKELKEKDLAEVERHIARLDEVSIVNDVVQPDHVMQLDFLNKQLGKWTDEQQAEAIRTNDRTRDTFCRRAAVVGFRAGMLAYFLYGEKNTPLCRRQTAAFAIWVANKMLTEHLLRYQIEETGSHTNRWDDIYKLLGDEFSREDLKQALFTTGCTTLPKNVLYHWRLLGRIEQILPNSNSTSSRGTGRFRKVKNE